MRELAFTASQWIARVAMSSIFPSAGDVPLNCHFAVGLQADYLRIRTTGTHHWVESGAATVNLSWDNGVLVKSEQTAITAYLRYTW